MVKKSLDVWCLWRIHNFEYGIPSVKIYDRFLHRCQLEIMTFVLWGTKYCSEMRYAASSESYGSKLNWNHPQIAFLYHCGEFISRVHFKVIVTHVGFVARSLHSMDAKAKMMHIECWPVWQVIYFLYKTHSDSLRCCVCFTNQKLRSACGSTFKVARTLLFLMVEGLDFEIHG